MYTLHTEMVAQNYLISHSAQFFTLLVCYFHENMFTFNSMKNCIIGDNRQASLPSKTAFHKKILHIIIGETVMLYTTPKKVF